jgi:DNA (cytosine-5)-methyltransferase 1
MLKVLDLFSGIGGMALGLERSGGFETAAFCEVNPFCRLILKRHWPHVHCYDDVRTLTAKRLADDEIRIDVICGGFPCQDISYAGRGAGLSADRSGLWYEFARLIGELGPRLVIVENVAALLDRGMAEVLGTLSDLGFDAEWSTVSACSVGATHMRRRVFIVADANGPHGWPRLRNTVARQIGPLQTIDGYSGARARARTRMENPSALYGGAHGVSYGMDEIKASETL